MRGPDGSVIAFNGEIYNFRELKAELEAVGHVFSSNSDTEVLLRLLIAKGYEGLARLNGIFAFAMWNAKTDELLVARDRIGAKPLYYSVGRQGVAICSEIKGLIHLLKGARSLDHSALARYVNYLWCPGDATPIEGVRKLPPGCAFTAKDGQISRFWKWSADCGWRSDGQIADLEEATDATQNAVRSAVHRQLVADVPVGSFLSGGLDSSAVVAMARERADIRCFTIRVSDGVEEGAPEDLPYAHKVAAHLGVSLDVVDIDAAVMAEDLEGMFYQLDEPLADPAALNVLYISRLARRSGIKVLLSGVGGDDLFAGYRRHAALNFERVWSWLPRPVRAVGATLFGNLKQQHALQRRISKAFRAAALSGDERIASYFSWQPRGAVGQLFSSPWQHEVAAEVIEEPIAQFLMSLPRDMPAMERMLALEQRFFLADHNLIYTDKMSMAAGIEVRVPLLDDEIVNLAGKIPWRYKQRGRTGKWIFKRAMEPLLPHDVIYRPKTGFGAPLRRWMCNDLKPLVRDILSRDRIVSRGLFDPSAINRLIEENEAGRVDGSYAILACLGIELWCSRFFDTPAAVIGNEIIHAG
jgi:asparagine synthase (glutamine-hydrolysing)